MVRFDIISGRAAAYLQFNQGTGQHKSSAAQPLLQKASEADHYILSLLGGMTDRCSEREASFSAEANAACHKKLTTGLPH